MTVDSTPPMTRFVNRLNLPAIECLQFYSRKIQIHLVEPLLVSNNAKNRVLRDEELTTHVLNYLHHVLYDLHDECIPIKKKKQFSKDRKYTKTLCANCTYFWIIWWIELNDPINCWNI